MQDNGINMVLRTVKVSESDRKSVIKRFFDEKELNAYLEEIYLRKMNRVALGVGLKKYTPKTGTVPGPGGISLFARPRSTTDKYYDMMFSCEENCWPLKVEITSENLNDLF